MPGVKHLIECHCFLKVFSQNEKQINHKFAVYSKINQNDKVIPKLVKCNNCEALHRITEVGISQLVPGRDQTSVTVTKEDLSNNLSNIITRVLIQYDCDISSWEHVEDIIEEKRWGEFVILRREIINEKTNVKLMEVLGAENIKIKNEIIDEFLK